MHLVVNSKTNLDGSSYLQWSTQSTDNEQCIDQQRQRTGLKWWSEYSSTRTWSTLNVVYRWWTVQLLWWQQQILHIVSLTAEPLHHWNLIVKTTTTITKNSISDKSETTSSFCTCLCNRMNNQNIFIIYDQIIIRIFKKSHITDINYW